MSLFLSLIGASTPTPTRNADDPRWWGGAASQSIAGVEVDADKALKISTVWACVQLLSETIASLPLVMYRQLPDGKQRDSGHPLYRILHDQPNSIQTAAEFREMMTGHVLLRGNAYAEIVPGPRGFVDQLMPIHPDRVKVEKLANGRLRYKVRQDDGTEKPYNQENIFHLRGPSMDGVKGMSIVEYARDSFGLTLAAERYGARFFRNDSRPGGVLKIEKKLSEDAAKRLKASWEAAHTSGNQSRVAILEDGMDWKQVGLSNEDAQYLETREFQAEDICRWFRVPPHMVGLTSKTTSWGSGIEQMGIAFVTYTLLPWLTRWEQAISRDLIIAPELYFASFVVEGLLRGEVSSRYSAYAVGRQWGWLSVNDIRRLENMNPIENGDVYLQPMNMLEAGDTMQPANSNMAAHYRLLAEEAAGRLVRKERAAVTRIFERGDNVAERVQDFYADHVELVSQTMRMSLAAAEKYCNDQASAIMQAGGWIDFDADAILHLAEMAVVNE